MPIQTKELFVIEKLKFTSPWIHVIQDLNIEVIIGIFYEKELQKIQKNKAVIVDLCICQMQIVDVDVEVDLFNYVAKSDVKKQQVLIRHHLQKS